MVTLVTESVTVSPGIDDETNKINDWINFGLDAYDSIVVSMGISAVFGVLRNAKHLPAFKLALYILILSTAILNAVFNGTMRRVHVCQWSTSARLMISIHCGLFGLRSSGEVLHSLAVFLKMRLFPVILRRKTILFIISAVIGLPVGGCIFISIIAVFSQVHTDEGCLFLPDTKSALIGHGTSFLVCVFELCATVGLLAKPACEAMKLRAELEGLALSQCPTRRTRLMLRREILRVVIGTTISALTFLTMAAYDLCHFLEFYTDFDLLWYCVSAATSSLASMSLLMSLNPYMAEDSILWRPLLRLLQWIDHDVYEVHRPNQPPPPPPPQQQLPLLPRPAYH